VVEVYFDKDFEFKYVLEHRFNKKPIPCDDYTRAGGKVAGWDHEPLYNDEKLKDNPYLVSKLKVQMDQQKLQRDLNVLKELNGRATGGGLRRTNAKKSTKANPVQRPVQLVRRVTTRLGKINPSTRPAQPFGQVTVRASKPTEKPALPRRSSWVSSNWWIGGGTHSASQLLGTDFQTVQVLGPQSTARKSPIA